MALGLNVDVIVCDPRVETASAGGLDRVTFSRERLDDLAALHGPAGLYIGSKTPTEITLSIRAEVVAAKNGVARAHTVAVADGKATPLIAGHASGTDMPVRCKV